MAFARRSRKSRRPRQPPKEAARPDDPAIETMVQIQCAIKEAGGAGSSSKTEARSAARPACSDGFDNVDGGPECGVYIQMRGIEQVCFRRWS
jgi:hypothetical protein